MHDRLAQLGAEAIIETLEKIETQNFELKEQNDINATPAPKIFKETCQIDWTKPGLAVKNFVRGLSPYPGAWCQINKEIFKIFATTISGESKSTPGSIVYIEQGKRLGFVCGDGKVLEILELQPPSKRRMTTNEFMRGYRLT